MERQVPYCANGHDGIPMLHTKTGAIDEYECPTCGKRIRIRYRDGKLEIER